MLKTTEYNNYSHTPSTIVGRSHCIQEKDRVISFNNLLDARLALEIEDKISSISNYKFKNTILDTACVMQRIKEAEHAQVRPQTSYISSLDNTSSSDNSPLFKGIDISNIESRSLCFNDSPMTLRQQTNENISLYCDESIIKRQESAYSDSTISSSPS